MLACYSYIGRAGSVLAQHQLLKGLRAVVPGPHFSESS